MPVGFMVDILQSPQCSANTTVLPDDPAASSAMLRDDAALLGALRVTGRLAPIVRRMCSLDPAQRGSVLEALEEIKRLTSATLRHDEAVHYKEAAQKAEADNDFLKNNVVNSLEGLRGDVKEVAGGVQETLDEVRVLRAEVALLLSKVTGALEASSSALSSLVSREVASLQLHLSEQVRGEADALRAELRSVLEGQAQRGERSLEDLRADVSEVLLVLSADFSTALTNASEGTRQSLTELHTSLTAMLEKQQHASQEDVAKLQGLYEEQRVSLLSSMSSMLQTHVRRCAVSRGRRWTRCATCVWLRGRRRWRRCSSGGATSRG